MIDLLILVLIVGLIYWVAAQFLPPPFPTIVLVVGLVILLIALINLLGDTEHVDTALLAPAMLGRWLIRD